MNNLIPIVSGLLKKHHYPIDQEALHKRLLSDPDNEVLAITNTLDHFGIENLAAEVPKDQLQELPPCFIAQLGQEEKVAFVLAEKQEGSVTLHFEDQAPQVLITQQFLHEWNGLVIAIDPNTAKKPLLTKANTLIAAVVALALLGVAYMAYLTTNWLPTAYFALTTLGFIVAGLIVKEKYAPLNAPGGLCNIGKDTSCQDVLSSDSATLFKVINLSDAVIIYFSFLYLACLTNPLNLAYLILPALAVPVIVYSVYSQAVTLKKWCPLCLTIGGIIVLQVAVGFFAFKDLTLSLALPQVLLLGLILGTVALAWALLKPYLASAQSSYGLEVENLTFKRNYHLFLPYYQSLPTITQLAQTPTLHFGHKAAPIQITMVTNPLCKACKKVHHTCVQLLEQHPEKVAIKVVFLVPFKKTADTRTVVAQRLITLYAEQGPAVCWQAMQDWFEWVNAKQWTKQWGQQSTPQHHKVLAQQVATCLNNGINATPGILLNNKKLPAVYKLNDLEALIDPLMAVSADPTAAP